MSKHCKILVLEGLPSHATYATSETVPARNGRKMQEKKEEKGMGKVDPMYCIEPVIPNCKVIPSDMIRSCIVSKDTIYIYKPR